MLLWNALRALARRWYVWLAAVAVALVASLAVLNAPGVYWSRVEVTFLAPASVDNPNALRPTSNDLILTARVVEQLVNGSRERIMMADPNTTLVGEGVRDGWSVQVPNYGGQWVVLHTRQILAVQVSGPSAEVVRERNRALLARIDEALASLQEGVAPRDRVTTLALPDEPPVRFIQGRRSRSLGMVWLLSGAAALAVSSFLDFRARRRAANPAVRPTISRRRPRAHAGGRPAAPPPRGR